MSLPSRRTLIAQALGAAGVTLIGGRAISAIFQTRLPDEPFGLGVASGEPTPDGVVIWTRLTPRPREPHGGMAPQPVLVGWQVAHDERFTKIAAAGETVAAPIAGHSVHVEVDGLRPDQVYFYRFVAAGHASPVGRTRTAPAPGDTPASFRAAFASCQKYEAGYYTAHAAIARAAPDVVFFLGDYIYEKALSLENVRRHPFAEASDLNSYRQRYAWYKSDPDLQASHAAAPWMPIWDDHEVSNDYGGDEDRRGGDPAAFLQRRAAAYQAYYEHMPLRRTSRPSGASMQLFRSLDWGRLAQFQLLDTRQYRAHRTCDAQARGRDIPRDCAERFDPRRSLLGARQEAWLQDRFRTSPAGWNVLTQQYPVSPPPDRHHTVSNDGWDGYVANRQRVLEGWRDAAVSNPIALGGDIHTFMAADIALNPGDKPIASEFVGGSISSLAREDAVRPIAFRSNPGLKYAEPNQRGFGLLELRRDTCTVTFNAVEDATRPGSKVRPISRWVVEAGDPGLKRA